MVATHGGRVAALALAALATQACATRGYVRQQVQESSSITQAAVVAARDSAIRAAAASAAAADEAMATQLRSRMDAQIAALRTDLEALERDFDARVTMMEESIQFVVPVQFAFDDARVRGADQPVLERFSAVVRKYYPASQVTIEGFADPAGSEAYNKRLSERRAEAVRTALVNYGLNAQQLRAIGYGEARLVTPGAWGDEPGAELNRRVVFAIETAGSPMKAVTSMDGAGQTR